MVGFNMIIHDFFGQELSIGDTIAFPSSGVMMLGTIEKFTVSKREPENPYRQIFVCNSSGNKNWKSSKDVIKKQGVINGL